MEPDKYLQSIRDLRTKIELYERMKHEIEEAQICIKASAPDEDRIQTSRKGIEARILRNMEKIKELDSWIVAARTKQLTRQDQAQRKILQLKEGQCKQFLLDYYIFGKSEKEIAKEYRYIDRNSVYNLKARSLKLFKSTFRNC